ncbi:hypothetical protein AB0J82_15355 [Asanoa sp. NPDC049518]|uniref:hypothetical protein n=1 Tax=unclassified Asanoa TaxID=2685164 RepID=UPI003435D94B
MLNKYEAAPGITATACVAAGMIGVRGDPRLIDALDACLFSGEDVVERWGAALGLSALLERLDDEVMTLVDQCCFDGPGDVAYFPLLNGELHDVAVYFYLRARERSAAARPLLLRRLTSPTLVRHPRRWILSVIEELFPQEPGEVRRAPRFLDLPAEQRQACTAFAQLRVLATVPNADRTFAQHGLPSTQAALDEWILAGPT